MKYTSIFYFLLCFFTRANSQVLPNVESVLNYPDELVADSSLMNYTIYKPYTNIACHFKMKQVSKTNQRTVFVNEDESIKMSFAFFDLQKLPFYKSSDSSYDVSYKFFQADSTTKARAYHPEIRIIRSDKINGLLYYSETLGDKKKIYLVGTKDNIVSLILVAGKHLDAKTLMADMSMSYKYNLKDTR